jgi:hypothetical protein
VPVGLFGSTPFIRGLMEYTNWHTITLNKNWGKGTAEKAA